MAKKTINFDDIDTSAHGYAPLPADYQGLAWSGNLYAADPDARSPSYGFGVGRTSGSNVITNMDEGSFSFTAANGGTFTFKSVEMTAGLDRKLTVDVAAYDANNTFMADKIVTLTDHAAKLEKFNWSGVNKVVFTPIDGKADPSAPQSGTYVVLDDLTVTGLPKGTGSPPAADHAHHADPFEHSPLVTSGFFAYAHDHL